MRYQLRFWNVYTETSESLFDYGREEQEIKTKVTVVLEQEMDNQLEATMQEIFEILNLALKFDIRDNPNDGTYSLVYAAYLKQRENNGIPSTQGEKNFCKTSLKGVSYHVCCLLPGQFEFNRFLRKLAQSIY